jgi:adenylate cyclase
VTWSLSSVLDIGSVPTDSEDLALQKRMLVGASGLVMVAAAIWGTVYLILDEPLAAVIPGGYAVLTAINLSVFAATKRYRWFRATQLGFYLVLPFLLQLALGGFVGASAVILWAVLAPLGALVMQGRREAVRYMIAYGVLLVVSLLLQPTMDIDNNLGTTAVGVFFLLNVLAVSGIAFMMLNYFVGQRDRIQSELAEERKRSDDLLLNILPDEVAADLKRDGTTEAKLFKSASVLFADLVGFTELAEGTAPTALVSRLNEIFTAFDEIAAKHDIEKIRTIGDAFMAASGVPVELRDHAERMARGALEMSRFVNGMEGVDFRFGISSGPLVAGVVGTSKFQYDIWGDTVNTASRMESSSEPGRIQLSDSTYRLIEDRFECEPRGTLDIRSKGKMRTWYLLGERTAPEGV